MTATPEIQTSLAGAIASVQGQAVRVGKAATANVSTKTGPGYSYTYATLTDVHDVVLPLLADAGLAWTVTMQRGDGKPWAVGTLHHVTTGETIDSWWPLPATHDPQTIGSAVTYARRYLLLAAVGVSTSDDDDGATAAAHARVDDARSGPAHTPDELTAIVKRAQDAGVHGEYEQLIEWVDDDPQARVDVAYGRIARAMVDAGVAVPA